MARRVGSKYEFIPSDENLLGRGSYATVYRGKEISTGAIVAVKVIAIHKFPPESRERKYLFQEIAIMKTIDHPNLIKLYEVHEEAGYLYLVLEYLGGGELHSLLQQVGRFEEPVARKFLCQISVGLKYLHERGILHRDLKPHNILLTAKSVDGDVKIGDFGFARVAAEMMESFLGSPLYMAPEMLRRQRYNNKTDLWSVGIIFYELLVGRTPFHEARTHMQLLELVNLMDVRPPERVSELCKDILMRLLQKKPGSRIDWEDFFEHKYLQPAMSSSSIVANEETWVQTLYSFDNHGQEKPFYLTHKKLIGHLKYELQGYVNIAPADQMLLTNEGTELEDHLTVEYYKFHTKRNPMYLINRRMLNPAYFKNLPPPVPLNHQPSLPVLSRTFNDVLQSLASMGEITAEARAAQITSVFNEYLHRASAVYQMVKNIYANDMACLIRASEVQLKVFQVMKTYAIKRSGQISAAFTPLADIHSTVEPRLTHVIRNFDNVMKLLKATQIHEALLPPAAQNASRRATLLDFLAEPTARANYSALEKGFADAKSSYDQMKSASETLPQAIQNCIASALPLGPRAEMFQLRESTRVAAVALKDKHSNLAKAWEVEAQKLRQAKVKVFTDADEDKAQIERLSALERAANEIEKLAQPVIDGLARIAQLRCIVEQELYNSFEALANPLYKLADSMHQIKTVLLPKYAELNRLCDDSVAVLAIPEQYSDALGELKRRRAWSQRMTQQTTYVAESFARAVDSEIGRRESFVIALGSHPAQVIQQLLPELVHPSRPVVALHADGLSVALPEIETSSIADDDFAIVVESDTAERVQELERENAQLKADIAKVSSGQKEISEQRRVFAGVQRIEELETQLADTKQTFDSLNAELTALRSQQKLMQEQLVQTLKIPPGSVPESPVNLLARLIQDRDALNFQLNTLQPLVNQLPGAPTNVDAKDAELDRYKRELASAHSLINDLLQGGK